MGKTLDWNLPLPNHLGCGFKSIYSKKIEYAEGKTAYFRVCHSWKTGEWMLIQPTWAKDIEYRPHKYKNLTEFQAETLEYCQKNGKNRYIGDKIVRTTNDYYRTSKDMNDLNAAVIPRYFERFLIDCIDEMVVFRFFRFRAHLPSAGETGGYEEFRRIFIHNNKIWAEYKSEPDVQYFWNENNYKCGLNTLLYMRREILVSYHNALFSVLRKNLNGVYIPEDYSQMFSYMPTPVKNTKFQRTVNSLNALVDNETPKAVSDVATLQTKEKQAKKAKNEKTRKTCDGNEDIELPFGEDDDIFGYEYEEKVNKVFYYERLSLTSFVIRMFFLNDDETIEYGRFFADENDVYPCYFRNGIVSRCDSMKQDFWVADNFFSIDIKGTILETRYPYLRDRKAKNILYVILMERKHLVLEQLEKLGFEILVQHCLPNYQTRELRALYAECGLNFNKNTKNTGINSFFSKAEFKRLCLFKDHIESVDDVMKLKTLFSNCGITGIDLIKKIANTMTRDIMSNGLRDYIKILGKISFRISDKKMNAIAEKVWCQVADIASSQTGMYYYVWTNLKDAYSMCSDSYDDDGEYYHQLSYLSTLRTAQDIKDAHDKLMSLVKFKQYSPEKFASVCEKHQKWQFSDDNFVVRLPESTEEIIMEGSKMNHCVGTYVDDFMHGDTIIMFLRRKSNPEKEYVTIEMGRDGTLRQVKCKNNYVVSSESTLEFLTKWVENKKLKVRTGDIAWEKGKAIPCANPYTNYFVEKDSLCKNKSVA